MYYETEKSGQFQNYNSISRLLLSIDILRGARSLMVMIAGKNMTTQVQILDKTDRISHFTNEKCESNYPLFISG